ncbi:PEP-CTERM sorting domain-containing protein [Nostoc sp. UHCC 0702]|nr:PEP-CTERM sorting domain-containing protein [Nostoc sp. UHCC 0702]
MKLHQPIFSIAKLCTVTLALLTPLAIFSSVESSPAFGATILSTDFNGRTVSGATASNLTWITNGVSDPGNLTADFSLFDTAATQNLFAVRRNLHTQGNWTADIGVAVGSQSIELSQISLDAYIFSGAGTSQLNSRDFDLRIDLLDSTKTSVLATNSVVDLFPNSNGIANPSPVPFVFDFTGNTLQANTTFFLRLTASGQGSNSIIGNNSGIDNLVVRGDLVTTPVPEPTSMLGILGFGAFGAASLLKRKQLKGTSKA